MGSRRGVECRAGLIGKDRGAVAAQATMDGLRMQRKGDQQQAEQAEESKHLPSIARAWSRAP